MYENPSRSFAQTFRFALLHVFHDFDLRGHASIICRAGNFAVVVHGVIELEVQRATSVPLIQPRG